MPVTPFTDFVAENEEGLTTFSRKPFSFNDLLLAPRVGLEPTTNRLTDVLVAWPFRAETVRVVGCYGNPMRLASTVVRLRALAKNHGNSELARVQFGRIRKRNRPVPRGASAAGRCRWTSSAPSRRLPPQRPVRLLRDGFRLLLCRIISTRSAGTPSASASRTQTAGLGKPGHSPNGARCWRGRPPAGPARRGTASLPLATSAGVRRSSWPAPGARLPPIRAGLGGGRDVGAGDRLVSAEVEGENGAGGSRGPGRGRHRASPCGSRWG